MPWVGDEWWDSGDYRREVEQDQMGRPKPTGILGPNGQEIHRLDPTGFTGVSRLVYVRRSRED